MDNHVHNSGLCTATFGGGCFWCLDAVFRKIKGVKSVISGFSGGLEANPSYDLACSGKTGHIEVVQIQFDEHLLPFEQLLAIFFTAHDPTQVNGQGNDIGPQYRSVIFYHDEQQQQLSRQLIDGMDNEGLFDQKIATELRPHMPFYPAPEVHQDFYQQRKYAPYCQFVIQPKLDKVQQLFAQLIKT